MSKGTLYQIIARTAFLLSSYLIHVSMAYFLADPKDYGDLGVIISMITIVRVFLSTGLPQATSRFIALEEEYSLAIFRQAIKIQLICSLVLLSIYGIGTPLWTFLLNDKDLTWYILISSILIPGTGMLQIFLAYLNGKRYFGQQAFFIGFYSICRFIFALVLVILGLKIFGILIGFIFAVAITLGLLIFRIKIPNISVKYDSRRLINFSIPIVIFSIAITFLLNLDVLLMKHFFPNAPVIGYYTGAMNLGKIPYFILFAYAVTLLPMVSKEIGNNNIPKARAIIKENITSLFFILIPACVIVFATAGPLLDFIYPENYRVADKVLKLLFCSMSGLAVLFSLCSIINAKGAPYVSMTIVIFCIPVQLSLGILLIPKYEMIGMAVANTVSVAVGLIPACFIMIKYFGIFFNIVLTIKVVVTSCILYYILKLIPEYPVVYLPFVYILSAVAFFIIIVFFDADLYNTLKKETSKLISRKNI